MPILNAIAPVFVIMLLGAGLRRYDFISRSLHQGINRLTYWVGVPSLLFVKTAQNSLDYEPAARVLALVVAGVIAALVAAYLASQLWKLPAPSAAALIQGAFRGNITFVGLPVILYASALNPGSQDSAASLATLTLAGLVPIHNITAVSVLVWGQQGGNSRIPLRPMLRGLVTNPLLIASLCGIAYSQTGWALPTIALRSLEAIGQMALPLALLGLGASLISTGISGRWAPASAAALIKVGVAPLAGYAIGSLWGLDPLTLRTALLYLACPTAVVSYVMAEQMDADAELAGTAVVLSTLGAFFSLALVLTVA